MKQVRIGDVVVHPVIGCKITVYDFHKFKFSKVHVECIWFDKNILRTGLFNADELIEWEEWKSHIRDINIDRILDD